MPAPTADQPTPEAPAAEQTEPTAPELTPERITDWMERSMEHNADWLRRIAAFKSEAEAHAAIEERRDAHDRLLDESREIAALLMEEIAPAARRAEVIAIYNECFYKLLMQDIDILCAVSDMELNDADGSPEAADALNMQLLSIAALPAPYAPRDARKRLARLQMREIEHYRKAAAIMAQIQDAESAQEKAAALVSELQGLRRTLMCMDEYRDILSALLAGDIPAPGVEFFGDMDRFNDEVDRLDSAECFGNRELHRVVAWYVLEMIEGEPGDEPSVEMPE